MPATRADYIAQPYVSRPRTYDNARLVDIIRMRGQGAAEAELRRGDAQANIWGGVTRGVSEAIYGWQQNKEAERERAERAPLVKAQQEGAALQLDNARMQNAELKHAQSGRSFERSAMPLLVQTEDGIQTYDRDEITREFTAAGHGDRVKGILAGLDDADDRVRKMNTEKREALAGISFAVLQGGATPEAFTTGLQYAIANGLATEKELEPFLKAAETRPESVKEIATQLASGSPKFAQMLQPKTTQVAPGATLVDERTGEAMFTAPERPKAPEGFTLSPGSVRYGPDGQPIASVPAAPRERQADNEPLIPVMGDDGQPVLMPRSQAAGRRPASNREQGRAVTSGDAGRIADFDTSLDDLAVVREALAGPGSTGAGSKVGTMLPNWFTEATTVGSESKQRQAVIDRVKQVIGKTLEGGVLRKEDEAKYEKILPTIGDPPEVVKSKLDGLEKAIALRKERFVEALGDAGYETGRFAQPTLGDRIDVKVPGGGSAGVVVRTPDGQSFTFPNQAQANAFKKRAGLP